MLEVKVFGSKPPCARCKELTKRAQNIADKYPGEISVTHYDALSEEGDKYGVMMTPTLVINDKVAAVGKLPEEKDIERMIMNELGES